MPQAKLLPMKCREMKISTGRNWWAFRGMSMNMNTRRIPITRTNMAMNTATSSPLT